jgi:hypothetical protein
MIIFLITGTALNKTPATKTLHNTLRTFEETETERERERERDRERGGKEEEGGGKAIVTPYRQ